MPRRGSRRRRINLGAPMTNTCDRCGEDFLTDELQRRTSRGGWIHARCASGQDDE